MKLLEINHDCLVFQRRLFLGVVIGEAGPSGVVSGFDGGKPSVLDREAIFRVKLSDNSFVAG